MAVAAQHPPPKPHPHFLEGTLSPPLLQGWDPIIGAWGTDALSLGPVTSAQPQEPSLLSSGHLLCRLAGNGSHRLQRVAVGSGTSRCGSLPGFAASSYVALTCHNFSVAPFVPVERTDVTVTILSTRS